MSRVWGLLSIALLCGACATTSNVQGGVLAKFAYQEGHALRVVSLPSDGPAYLAGMRAGDRVIQIEKSWVSDLTLKEAVEKLRGPVGTLVLLKVKRNEEVFSIRVERMEYAHRRK